MHTLQHQLQKFDPGIVWLDDANHILALNTEASKIFGANAYELIGEEILQLHPESSRAKVEWLLKSSTCPVESPPPMTMMINTPDKVLLVKVSRMVGKNAGAAGTCMILFDLTDITTTAHEVGEGNSQPRPLFKLPVYKHNKVMLVNLDEVAHLKADGHYTSVYTRDEQYLCNLSLSELEVRLNAETFVRVHRSHVINMNFAKYFEKVDEQCTILMETSNEESIPVSRSKVKMLRIILGLAQEPVQK